MADLYGFDANSVDPREDFEAIPPGKYLAMITESETKTTKAGTGNYLELTFQILEGDYKGRLVWARLNLQNANPKAVQIARSELSAICRAVGILKPRDSAELHNLPLVIKVKCKKREGEDEFTNEVRGYFKREAANGQPQQATNSTPPWKRNQAAGVPH